VIAALATLALGVWSAQASPLPGARPCRAAEMAALTASETTPYRLVCRAALNGAAVTRPILIQGSEASGAGLDCGGGAIGRAGNPVTTRQPTIAIWSRAQGLGFSRPTDVHVRNCTIHGSVRIWGMGAGGSMSDLKPSSQTQGHTVTAQRAAPTRVELTRLDIRATGSIPVYVGPGVTALTLQGSRLTGRSVSVGLYLDAESRSHLIQDNVFDLATGRELVAVDGSAFNRIIRNRFNLRGRGGIFLYRNCGEDGVIRHQTPSDNQITDNVFSGVNVLRARTVVIGSRNGGRRYCNDDQGFPFGSSADDGDRAERNVVARNRTQPWSQSWLVGRGDDRAL